MAWSVGWFMMMGALTVLGWCAGQRLGRDRDRKGRLGLALGVVLLAAWAWLAHHPAAAVRIVPPSILVYIQGTAAAPAFMLIMGIAWSWCRINRQKRVVGWAAALGVIYFLQGGMWMLQATPSVGFAQTVEHGPVMQSQAYSCVPASCATALNELGVYTSEAEMARLTQVRPGTGATIVRALHGLDERLARTHWRADLLDLSVGRLKTMPTPILTPLQFEPAKRHMVAILKVDSRGLTVADPVEGVIRMDWPDFSSYYTGEVIVFQSARFAQPRTPATPAPSGRR